MLREYARYFQDNYRGTFQLIVVLNVRDTRNVPVSGARVDVNDTDSPSRLHAVFLERRSLSVSTLGHGQQRPLRLHGSHRDDLVPLPEVDTSDPVGGAAHGAGIGFLEPDRHPVTSADEHLALAIRQLGSDDRRFDRETATLIARTVGAQTILEGTLSRLGE